MHAKMAATLVRALVFFIVSINVLVFEDRYNALNILHVTPTAGLQSLRFHRVLSSTVDIKGVWFAGILEAWFI